MYSTYIFCNFSGLKYTPSYNSPGDYRVTLTESVCILTVIEKDERKVLPRPTSFVLPDLNPWAYKKVGYNLDVMQQSACLVLNSITVYSYGFLFNCTTVGQASDSMTALA